MPSLKNIRILLALCHQAAQRAVHRPDGDQVPRRRVGVLAAVLGQRGAEGALGDGIYGAGCLHRIHVRRLIQTQRQAVGNAHALLAGLLGVAGTGHLQRVAPCAQQHLLERGLADAGRPAIASTNPAKKTNGQIMK